MLLGPEPLRQNSMRSDHKCAFVQLDSRSRQGYNDPIFKGEKAVIINKLQQQLIDQFQKSFPICSRPFKVVAQRLGVLESEVLEALQKLKSQNVLSRLGPVFAPNKVGVSTLAALKLAEDQLESVAEKISELDSVNHNYEREHAYNLWFVITAANEAQLLQEIKKIESIAQSPLLNLPLEREFFIDLSFPIDWKSDESKIC